MKISHHELENCYTNPAIWARKRIKNNVSDFIRRGYDGSIKLAIFAFHKTEDEKYAKSKLSSYLSNFTSVRRIKEAEDTFRKYINWYEAEKPIVVQTRVRLNIDIDFDNILSGEVSRVDIKRDMGYRGILIGSIPRHWSDQIRMPLIQFGLAQIFKRRQDEIEVGWQDLSGKPFYSRCYKEKEINIAFERVRNLSRSIYEEIIAHT